ncbi:ComEC/Rec2 family competence protein [Clostridium sp. YIM B02551]|uniref:ComEC/Rec2 family competence protein n=1 Tax=Clostridium sp. YIM B02551 TaxID=2910679 RepID=UPI001EE9CB25|nr:ComEC/Rec2 family competence protein [Clostridium sp. YIM B02551]
MKKLKFLSLLLVLTSLLFISCSKGNTISSETQTTSGVKIHYIDVGQGDAILIQYKDKNLLIDSSTSKEDKKFKNYINSLKIKKFDAIVATHPDEDHIGNMDWVIKNFDVGKFYAPKKKTTTAAFKDMVAELNNKDLKINVLKGGSTIDFSPDLKLDVFAPNSDNYGDDNNNYSAIIKLTYGNNTALFTGDAEKESEAETLQKGYNLKSDILKVGHHGSSTSTSKNFLQAVNPKYAIISCGKDNKYGHPHKETIDKLKAAKVKYYRTDLDGTIIATLDGKTITFNK